MRNYSVTVLVLLGVFLFSVQSPPGLAQSPTSLPLVQQGNLRYLGSFGLPRNDGSGVAAGDLAYGGTAMGMSASGGLFVAGHDQTQRLCEVSIPALGGTATIRQRCVDVTEGRMLQIDNEGIKLGGSLVYNGRLIVSAFSFYDADGDQVTSHFVSGTTLASTGDVTGPVRVGTAPAGFVSGYMGLVPAEWRALLGGPALTGNCCIPIISRTSSGPAVSVFNPDDVGRVSPVPARQLLGYPLATPLANADTANPYYTRADNIGGVAFPPGTRSVLFIGRHGTGLPCYGLASECNNDKANIYKGEHSYPYAMQVWAYDANDLLAVKNGTKQPSQLRPYATLRLPEINSSGTASIAGATFDPATRRLYVSERYEESPRVHVYEITAGTAALAAPPVEVCGDRIDNDGDGAIDEGCSVGGPGPSPTPEVCDGIDNDLDMQIDEGCAAPARVEVCGDGVDNNGDGSIDEGCPGAPLRLVGDARGSSVSLSWLAPIAGTTPAQYIVEAGLSAGQTAQTFVTGARTSVQVPNVGSGKYVVRVRAQNGAGFSLPSNEIAVSVGCAASPSPLANLVAKVRGGLVSLDWIDPDGCGDTSYRINVADRSGGAPIAQFATESVGLMGVAGPGTYYVRAASVNGRGSSTPSGELSFVVSGGGCVPPQFATRLASRVTGRLVELAWEPMRLADALAADAVAPIEYVLEVGSGPNVTDILRTTLGRTTSLASPVAPGTYYARIRSADVCGSGAASNEVIVRVP